LYGPGVVTVSARSANVLPEPAKPWDGCPEIDLRRSDVRAGTFGWDGPDADTGWHRHAYHQVEYALEGVAEVTTPHGRYLLPPQQAIWIPAGLPHATTLRGVRSVAAFFVPESSERRADRALVLGTPALLREMLLHALRWPIERRLSDPFADAYFDVLARIVDEALDDERPLCLPAATDPLLRDALAYVDEHLATATLAGACRAASTSERTLRRRLSAELGMTWAAYLLRARVLRALALLSAGDRAVIEVGNAVGFTSPSAFTRAFRRVCGETPSAFRERIRSR
jgi:AraC-like DNA-binding protein